MDIPWSQIATFSTAALSAVAAAGSWRAAQRANVTTKTVARIERDRWHSELTPKFRLTLTDSGFGHAKLVVHLEGPDDLRRLDGVTLRVIDDDMNHNVLNPGTRPTQQEVDKFVWGPFRFTPHTDGADPDGREVPAYPMDVGKGRPYSMERTRRGYWMEGTTDEQWQERYAGHPIRLMLTCRRGDEEWVLVRELENPPYSRPS